MDVLADVLRALRLHGTAYFDAEFQAPWGMEISNRAVANFHVVVRGRCVVRWLGGGPAELRAGDIIVFPHGETHALSDQPRTPTPPASELLSTRREEGDRTRFGASGESTTMVCGHFELDPSVSHPLLEALPSVLLLRSGEGTDPEWVATATRLAVLESQSGRSGSTAIVDRLAEALMIQVIRAHAENASLDTGFLAALGDRVVGPALGLLHADPATSWSVENLAREIGASRSLLASRFKMILGQSPIHYLTAWRMQCARELLRGDELTIADVAERVGYQSEFAFAKAFKRVFGEGPGAARRSA